MEALPFDPEPKTPDKPAEPAADKLTPAPSVTIDDITKVIVAKIKKKRGQQRQDRCAPEILRRGKGQRSAAREI